MIKLPIKNTKLLIFSGALCFIGIIAFYQTSETNKKNSIFKSEKETQQQSFYPRQDNTHISNTLTRKPATIKKQDISTVTFKRKQEEIELLSKNYPQSKKQLIAFISSKDILKSKDNKILPHSVNEIKQHQEGALKVLALRALMKNSAPQELKQNLKIIIEKAQDPTISRVAKAILRSVKKGRPFFKDFGDAITQL